MSLENLASVAAVVGNFALTLTLVYVAMQVRQADKNQRATIQQGRANRVSEFAMMLSEPSRASLMSKGAARPQGLSREELDQFLNICRAAFLSGEDSFLQHKAGLLDKGSWRGFVAGATGTMAGSLGMRAAWRLTSTQFDPGFAAFMDALLTQNPAHPQKDRLAAWVSSLESDVAAPERRHAGPSPLPAAPGDARHSKRKRFGGGLTA